MLSRQALRSLRAAAPQRTFAQTSVRCYAAAPAPQDVRAPVSVYGLDGTYATALVRYLHSAPVFAAQLRGGILSTRPSIN